MKMKVPHIVPLSDQVIAILEELRPITGWSKFLFPGQKDAFKPMSNMTILRGLKRMGYQGRTTGHGFRTTASTVLNEMGFNPDAIERQLAHGEKNTVRAAYNRAKYLEDRREIMQSWADYLDSVKDDGEKVIPINRKQA
jgi:integrase